MQVAGIETHVICPDRSGPPALPEHQEIAPEPPTIANEFEQLLDDEPDDDAVRLQRAQDRMRRVARQVALDPDDHMGL